MFAVGAAGTIQYYDGTVWNPMPSGTTQYIRSVWGSSARDVFAVGAIGMVLHWDGSGWSGRPSGTTRNLQAVWGSSADDVFAVGAVGTILEARARPAYGGICAAPVPLYCAPTLDPYNGDTGGGTATFASYSCPSGRPTTGPEVFYRLDCPVTGTVTVRLTPAEADLDLILIGEDTADPERGCDPTRCLAASQQDGLAVEEVTFASTRDARYYAVVDGYAGAVSGYTLEIVCAKQ
ncbi:MAG: hypothetical protein HY906_04315 [Deltaproteobacteria bacterium]|nr:hypothetical protein [Deltaproteobacteria bacterium]